MSDPSIAHPYAITGTASSIIANRVSYFYDFRGPSVAVDTACSSSLVAVHQGVQALRARGRRGARRRRQRVDHPAGDGRVRRGRRRAGLRRPDQVVLAGRRRLRPLRGRRHAGAQAVADARRDGDEILAVIAGSAINHDGRSNGLLAPNPDAQAEVLRKAYKDAGINPRDVDYIEAHGTGTILGDPIEADALGRVVGRPSRRQAGAAGR